MRMRMHMPAAERRMEEGPRAALSSARAQRPPVQLAHDHGGCQDVLVAHLLQRKAFEHVVQVVALLLEEAWEVPERRGATEARIAVEPAMLPLVRGLVAELPE